MKLHREPWFSTFLVSVGCLLGASIAHAGGDKKAGDKDVLFSKIEHLSDKDAKDTKAITSKSFCRVYTVKLTEGQVYRIDLASKDFDTYLRLENSKKKEVASNDDVAPNNLDSRVTYIAPKTGDYRIIVTSFEPGKTGLFTLEMKHASAAEAAEARFLDRIERMAESAPADQKSLLKEANKRLADKGEKLTIEDALFAMKFAFAAEEAGPDLARAAYASFIKLFGEADDKRLAGFTKFLEREVPKLKLLGTEFPISGKTVDGKDFDLKKLKGKVVLVDFWATWCQPCIAELPNMEAAYKEFHGKGFEIVGVSLDRPGDDEKLAKFIQNRKMPWACINIEDSRPLANKYEVNAIPFPVLIGRDGRVVSYRARGEQLERLLERLLAEKK